MPSEPVAGRPMPRADRIHIIAAYTGRRRALATAADAYVRFYEQGPGFGIDWASYQRSSVAVALALPLEGTGTTPACLCEEDFLGAVLWAMISNTPVQAPHAPQEVLDA